MVAPAHTPPAAAPLPGAQAGFDGGLQVGPIRCAWRDYQRGVAAEPLVRPWLAQALQQPEAALGLWRDVHGRPHLAAAHRDVDTNWSHSGEALLVALGTGVDVGVDIEWLRPRHNAMPLATRFFAPSETAILARLAPDDCETAFVRLWCAKEAVLKAHGRGLSFGLHRLAFILDDQGWSLTDCDPELGRPVDWSLHAFAPMPGYLATLAWRARQRA
ncbi:4'-phosphopantetheinyl transferase family protein [Luteimonas sp. RIT-PG2_3]